MVVLQRFFRSQAKREQQFIMQQLFAADTFAMENEKWRV